MIAEKISAWPTAVRVMLALALPLGFVVLATCCVVALKIVVYSQTAWQHTARQDLAQGKAARALVGEVSAALKSLPSQPIWQRLYSEKDSEENQSALLTDVTQTLHRSGVANPIVKAEPTAQAAALDVWACQVTFEATAEQFHAFAEQLRALPRYVRVKDLVIRSPPLQVPLDNASFSVIMRVEGYSSRSHSLAMAAVRP